ncbi:MAG: hypothetical protein KF723_22755 [Rhizobiaceae bacterium]|nr:hypothetical protein [Rhizobiaceae bacterium]
MHYIIAAAGIALCIHGYAWSAGALGIPETFERSLISDIRIGFGLVLLALAAISYQLRRKP